MGIPSLASAVTQAAASDPVASAFDSAVAQAKASGATNGADVDEAFQKGLIKASAMLFQQLGSAAINDVLKDEDSD